MKVSIQVLGVRPTTQKSGPTLWRLALAEAVTTCCPDAPYEQLKEATFAVTIDFHLVKERMFIQPNQPVPPDLDNLLKPVLDTLFTSDNVVGPTGTLVARNDTYVTDVHARKTEAATTDAEGADIAVEW